MTDLPDCPLCGKPLGDDHAVLWDEDDDGCVTARFICQVCANSPDFIDITAPVTAGTETRH